MQQNLPVHIAFVLPGAAHAGDGGAGDEAVAVNAQEAAGMHAFDLHQRVAQQVFALMVRAVTYLSSARR